MSAKMILQAFCYLYVKVGKIYLLINLSVNLRFIDISRSLPSDVLRHVVPKQIIPVYPVSKNIPRKRIPLVRF